jgi:hypothetical protein
MDRAREEDPKRRAARELIEHLKTHFGTREFTVKELFGKANETNGTYDFESFTAHYVHPELNELLVENCGSAGRRGAIDPNRVGHLLKRLRDQVHADGSGATHRIIASADTSHGNRWRVQST